MSQGQCPPEHQWVVQTTSGGKVYLWCEKCAHRSFIGYRLSGWERFIRKFRRKSE